MAPNQMRVWTDFKEEEIAWIRSICSHSSMIKWIIPLECIIAVVLFSVDSIFSQVADYLVEQTTSHFGIARSHAYVLFLSLSL